MTDYATFVYPVGEDVFEQTLTSSLDDGLDRWDEYRIYAPIELPLVSVGITAPRGVHAPLVRDTNAFVYPDWSSLLFGHIIVIPARLDLGNVLSDQTRTVEVANLFLEDRTWLSVSTTVGGLEFQNDPISGSPPTPYVIQSFGSYLLEVSISATGPVSIAGLIHFVFDVEELDLPVTGTRVIVLNFQPLLPIMEQLEWTTDIVESYDGSEQRIALRTAPISRFVLEFIKSQLVDNRIRQMMIDWLPRIFAVPVWWEVRRLTSAALTGDTVLNVSTLYGRFEVGQLLFIYLNDEVYESIEITALDDVSVTLTTGVARDYPATTLISPIITAYAKTVPSSSRIPNVMTRHSIEFTAVEPVYFGDDTGTAVYDEHLILDECNLSVSGEQDSWSRPVTVLDGGAGRLSQFSRMLWSRFHTRKVWDVPTQEELWRIRQLLHFLHGGQVSFFLPSFRFDFQVTDTIAAGSPSMRVVYIGYTPFSQSQRPYGDIRITRVVGAPIIRRVVSSVVDGNEELITMSGAFDVSVAIPPENIVRAELVYLVRISDDTATIEHTRLGEANISINLVTVRE